jgi:hypothetical protein
MNDRNQRNTAPRKLPGIHPEYIIHTGVPARRPPRWVKRSRTAERTRPRRKRSVPVKSHVAVHRARRGLASRGCTRRDHPGLFLATRFPSSPVQLCDWICSFSLRVRACARARARVSAT